jgi:hypothetical protein
MAHARHKAPGRFPRLDPRRAEAVVVLVGATMLAVAAIGASSGSPAAATATRAAVAVMDVTAMAAPTTDELADLHQQRAEALLQASRAADRSATDVAPPRLVAPSDAVLPATTPAYTTIAVNVREAASEDAGILTVLEPGAEIAVTGRSAGGYLEVVFDGGLAWVYAGYVAATPPAEGVSGAECASGSGVESGLVANAVAVHRAVCALFPGVSGYGGVRPGDGGDHGSGRALDIMVSTGLGNEIVAYLQAHASELGIAELIWRQHIWTAERAGDGWRWMEDRGSSTANHYDHVHVSVS